MIAIIGYIAACFTSLSILPQILHTIKTKDVAGISIPSWVALSTGITLWLIYGIYIKSGPVVIANSVSLIFDLTLIFLALKWKTVVKTNQK